MIELNQLKKGGASMNTYSLRCQDCNGVMAVDKDRQVISCPYCGSERMIIESDNVKIEQIKADARIKEKKMDAETRKRDDIFALISLLGLMLFGIILMLL